jgi:hypothetical protein
LFLNPNLLVRYEQNRQSIKGEPNQELGMRRRCDIEGSVGVGGVLIEEIEIIES